MPLTGCSQAPRKSGVGSATLKGSRRSGPAITESRRAASRTVRATDPTWARVGAALAGYMGTRPNWGLMPKSPESEHGMRTEPPPSVQMAKGVMPAATLAAAPALEPPGVLSVFHGLRVMPVRGQSPTALHPSSLVVVLPIMEPPWALIRSTGGASIGATLSAKAREPRLSCTPLTGRTSLTESGRPERSPASSPATIFFSAVFAASIASSGVGVAKQLSFSCNSDWRSRDARVTSTGEISLASMAAFNSTALR